MKQICLAFILLGTLLSHAAAVPLLTGASEGMRFQLEEVSAGLKIPWGMVFHRPDELLITERSGHAKLLNLTSGQLTPLSGLPAISTTGQGGLLDIATPPGYHPGDWLYMTYSKTVRGQATTVLARARLKNGGFTDWQELLVGRARSTTGRHFGSRISFDGKGHLFFGIGDRGVRPNGQDLSNHAGAILRLNLDGTIPADNPFVDHPNALPEIWSYGHRNPQGLFYDRNQQRLWEIEHGPRGGDEINLIRAGLNYGWPVVSHGKEYWGQLAVGEATSRPGMEDPVKVYIPSIAPGSLLVYSGAAFPAWQGNLFAGALKLQHLNRISLTAAGETAGEERLLQGLRERIRALVESPEGWLYLSTDSGRILRLRPRVD